MTEMVREKVDEELSIDTSADTMNTTLLPSPPAEPFPIKKPKKNNCFVSKILIKGNLASKLILISAVIALGMIVFGFVQPILYNEPTRPTFTTIKEGMKTQIHVTSALKRFGYILANTIETLTERVSFIWAKRDMFYMDANTIFSMAKRRNQFGSEYMITNKFVLCVMNEYAAPYVLKSFAYTTDKEAFDQYVKEHPNKLFLSKGVNHMNIAFFDTTNITINTTRQFVQEFLENPLLVDGYKFDFGIYVVITSANPLRIYIYTGDVLFRYCFEEYHPFDLNNTRKYINGLHYRPTWEIPALRKYSKELGFGMKNSFEAYMKEKGVDTATIWKQAEHILVEVFKSYEIAFTQAFMEFQYGRTKDFQLFRVDFIVDENLKVYLLESNLGPNLYSYEKGFESQRILYDQILYNMFNVVGISSPILAELTDEMTSEDDEMLSSDRNIFVSGDECLQKKCLYSCDTMECRMCRRCMTMADKRELHIAYREHMRRGDMKRIYPIPMDGPEQFDKAAAMNHTEINQFMAFWFYGKCLRDITWCN